MDSLFILPNHDFYLIKTLKIDIITVFKTLKLGLADLEAPGERRGEEVVEAALEARVGDPQNLKQLLRQDVHLYGENKIE